jgi:hypothetical protein
MWQGFVGQLIAASNRTLRRFGTILLAAAISLGLYGAISHDPNLAFGYFIVGVLVLSSLWALYHSWHRTESPESHPLGKALARYGPLYSLVPQIDVDAAAGTANFGGTTFTRNWILTCGWTRATAMCRDEIIWAYKKRVKHSVNFMPTGSTYSLVLGDARGQLLELSNSEQNVDLYFRSLADQTPWIVFGHEPEVERLYKKERESFVQSVSERKRAIQTQKTQRADQGPLF